MLKYREPVNLAFVKELFWKETFFPVSYTKILIFGRENLSGYKYINYLAINILSAYCDDFPCFLPSTDTARSH